MLNAPQSLRIRAEQDFINDNRHVKPITQREVPSNALSDDFTFTTPSAIMRDMLSPDSISMIQQLEQETPRFFASTVSESDTSAIFDLSNMGPTTTLPNTVLSVLSSESEKPDKGFGGATKGRTMPYDPLKSPPPTLSSRPLYFSPPLIETPRRARGRVDPVWSNESNLIATSDPVPWKEPTVQSTGASHSLSTSLNGMNQMIHLPPGLKVTESHSRNGFADLGFSQKEHGLQDLPTRDLSLFEAMAWWTYDYRSPMHREVMMHLNGMALAAQDVQAPNEIRIRQQNHILFAPLLANLEEYLRPAHQQIGQFGSWAPCPEWSVDGSSDGLRSFFGEDWGAPPPRVGRDPRYRNPDGGRGPFEETWNRLGRDRRSRW